MATKFWVIHRAKGPKGEKVQGLYSPEERAPAFGASGDAAANATTKEGRTTVGAFTLRADRADGTLRIVRTTTGQGISRIAYNTGSEPHLASPEDALARAFKAAQGLVDLSVDVRKFVRNK